MQGLLQRAVSRHLLRQPWQLGLALLGIALGIAVVCAVQLTQASARQALAYAQRSLSGPATHRLEAAAGDERGLAERDYAQLALRWPRLRLMPALSGRGTLAGDATQSLSILGVDLVAGSAQQGAARRLGASVDFTALLTRPGTAVVNLTTARRLGLAPGASLALLVDGRARRIEIVGLAPAARDGGPADDLLVMDIASAQETLDAAGRLSAVDLALPRAGRQQLAAALRRDLPAGWRLTSNATRLGAAREMTRAFDVNLSALSLLALLVGMFLVYNTVSFLALQRRPLFARLRALGVSARELFTALAVEACLLGLVGIALGLVLGRIVAGALLQLVARTVNDLYYRAAITEVATPPWLLAAIALLGLAATLAAALPPIRNVTRETVAAGGRSATTTAAASAGLPLLAMGCAWGLGAALLAWPTRALWPGFGALFAFLVGAALPLPWLLARLAHGLSRRRGLSLPLLLASRALAVHDHRAGLAAAALMVACATGLAIAVMVASFRVSVTDWLSALLRADVYVDLGSARGSDGARPLAALRERIARLPEVATTSAVVRTSVRVAGVDAPVQLLVYDLPPAARAGYTFIAGDVARLWQAWDREDVAIVTEPYAYRHEVRVGDTLELETAAGQRRLRVLGIYRDYANERGSIAIGFETWRRHFPLRDDAGLGVYARPGVDTAALERALRTALADAPGLRLQSNAKLRELSLEVFDHTFSVTDVLRLLALGVAIVGIVSALLAQQMERLTDYALLRALGVRAEEILRVVLWQTALAGALAATVALPVGIALALLLIDVINVRSFGWTMSLHLPWTALASAWLSALLAALVAGLYPAAVATRRTPASVLRND
ncbi:MAG TPA: ABC transporter permease [Gammaproteobacteria bacterium]|nr:ABC transporter permease [Gammaproteobacteria bacterium]